MKTNSINRRDFLRLAGLSAGAAALAACSPAATVTSPAPAATEAPTAVKAAEATATSVPTAVPSPTAAPTTPPMVELSWHVVGNGAPADLASVENALNERLATTKVKFMHYDWGSYNDKMNLAHAGGEPIDIEFTAPWTNNYASNVANGIYTPIDELLGSGAPELWRSMAPTTWNAARIKGKIYGVINQQLFPKMFGVAVRKDLAEKYKLDLNAINSYGDEALFQFMEALKKGGDVKYITLNPWVDATPLGYDPVVGSLITVGINDADAKAVLFPENADYAAYIKLLQKWAQAGFYSQEGVPDEDATVKAGQVGMILARNNGAPGTDIAMKDKYGMEWVYKCLHTPFINTDGVVATLNAVPTTCKNPERAIKFLNLVNSDPEIYNLVCYGVEKKHWNWKDQSKKVIEKVKDSGYDPNSNWEFGNAFNGYYIDPSQIAVAEEQKKINETAKASPVLGFSLDKKPVETELASFASADPIFAEIYGGMVKDVDASIAEAVKTLKNAGSDKVLAEVQRQIVDWKATL